MKNFSRPLKESIAITDTSLAIFARAYHHIPVSISNPREGTAITQKIRDAVVSLFGRNKEQGNLNLAEEKR